MSHRKEVQIDWIIRKNMQDVLKIERCAFEYPWSEDDFLAMLRTRNCIGMVAEHNHEIAGYMIYELHKSRLSVRNFAVAKAFRRCEVGTQMMQKLIGKLSPERRTEITLEVQEENLSAQMFFKSLGFRAYEVLYDWYDDPIRNAYALRYQLEGIDDTLPLLNNRISAYLPKENDA